MEDVTGPPMLLQSLKTYNATLGLAHVKILEPGIIFPIDWRYTSQDWKNAGVLSTVDTVRTVANMLQMMLILCQFQFGQLACYCGPVW